MQNQSVHSTMLLAAWAVFSLAGCASHEQPAAESTPVTSPAAISQPVVAFTPTPEPPPPQPAPVVPAPVVPAPPPVVNPGDLPLNVVAWDSADKSVTVNAGEPVAKFQFSLTNVSDAPVTVVAVPSSCGCTVPKVPQLPWRIPAGGTGSFDVNMDLRGKAGTVIKTISFATDKGTKHLLVRTTILPLATAANMAPGSREVNQQLALADRQAVFRGDCATCHANTTGKQGKELYASVCGVCHEAEHRASSVPDLKIARVERNTDYWKNWIGNGRAGSMMPAFSKDAGGILDDTQIASLVEYLSKNMPSKPVAAPAGTSNALDPNRLIAPPAH